MPRPSKFCSMQMTSRDPHRRSKRDYSTSITQSCAMSLSDWDWSERAECPHSFECDKGLTSFDIGMVPSCLSIASSTLSCLGSLLIVLTYCLLKDMRSGAQTVITLLAIADFFTAFGYIIGSSNYIINFTDHRDLNCAVFTYICEIQSFVTTWSTMSSYCWNCILAFYFFMTLVYHKSYLASRLIPLYNIVAWIAPLLIVFPLLVINKLGYAPYVASNWCYIKDMDYHKNLADNIPTIIYILVAGKLWEILCYAIILVLYSWIKISFMKTKRRLQRNRTEPVVTKIVTVEKRLLAIPILYIVLRMWGTLQFFYSLIVANQNQNGCIPPTVRTIYLVFGLLQAIGDGGQGWCNAILYVLLSPTIRRKLCGAPCESCLQAAERKIQKMLESSTSENDNRVERAIVSEINNNRQSTEYDGGLVESTRLNPGVAASGYKIQKYSESQSANGTQSPLSSRYQGSTKVISASTKFTNN